MIDRNSGEDTQTSEADDEFVTDASSISSGEEDNLAPLVNGAASLFPVKPKSLDPPSYYCAHKEAEGCPNGYCNASKLNRLLPKERWQRSQHNLYACFRKRAHLTHATNGRTTRVCKPT